MKKTGFNKSQYKVGIAILCAAVILGILAFVGMNGNGSGALGSAGTGNVPANAPSNAEPQAPKEQNASVASPGSVATGSGGEAQVPHTNATAAKEVTIDFLYADWCGHCQAMKPIAAKLESELPKDRFEVRYWNEASRSKEDVSAIYAKYADAGYFTGFPTFVANGNDPIVGSMPEAAFRSWVCSKFQSPKPAGC